jgi:protein-disulfide isomerase
MKNNLGKYITIFIAGLIIGFLINKVNLGNLFKTPDPNVLIKTIGQASAPVTMTEYSDFQCPLCKKYFTDSFSQIKTKYIDTGKVKYVFKDFPLTSIHPNARKAAEAADCALEQNKFWEMHDLLFTKQSEWSGEADPSGKFAAFATELQLNSDQFSKCLETSKYKGAVSAEMKEGRIAGLSGTPSFDINGEEIVGAQELATFEAAIDGALGTK